MSYQSVVLVDSPRMYLRFQEATGTFADSSGLNHPGTASGTIQRQVSGAIRDEYGIQLDGATGYVQVTDHADLDLGDVFTLECWVKTTDYAKTFHQLFDKGAGAYAMWLESVAGPHLTLYLVRTDTTRIVAATTNFPEDGAWHHLVATKNGAAFKLYQDGVDVTGGLISGQTFTDTATDLFVGRYYGSAVQFLNGSIDEVAVYATALSAGQVLAHYRAGQLFTSRGPDPLISR